jgi:hypothetical protein
VQDAGEDALEALGPPQQADDQGRGLVAEQRGQPGPEHGEQRHRGGQPGHPGGQAGVGQGDLDPLGP